jgi:hypothetical protein
MAGPLASDTPELLGCPVRIARLGGGGARRHPDAGHARGDPRFDRHSRRRLSRLVVVDSSCGPRSIVADLRDPVLAPFVPVAAITGMLLGSALSACAFGAGRVLVVVFLTITVVVGGWLTGQCIAGDLDQGKFCPGYRLAAARRAERRRLT